MKKYIIKYVPSDKPIKIGDKAWDKSDGRIMTVTQIYEDKNMDGQPVTMIGDNESCNNVCIKVDLWLCSIEINTGDRVVIFETDGVIPRINDIKVGVLTRKWIENEYPECEIDGKSFDLVSEGHTSDVYKIICEISLSPNNSWIKENMEFDDSEVKVTHCYDYKKAKYLDIGDKVEIDDKTPYPLEGVIKKIHPKYENEFGDSEDQILLTNVRKAIDFTPDEGDGWKYKICLFDMTVKRKDIQDRNKKIVYECEIKCPCCGHFCYSC